MNQTGSASELLTKYAATARKHDTVEPFRDRRVRLVMLPFQSHVVRKLRLKVSGYACASAWAFVTIFGSCAARLHAIFRILTQLLLRPLGVGQGAAANQGNADAQ